MVNGSIIYTGTVWVLYTYLFRVMRSHHSLICTCNCSSNMFWCQDSIVCLIQCFSLCWSASREYTILCLSNKQGFIGTKTPYVLLHQYFQHTRWSYTCWCTSALISYDKASCTIKNYASAHKGICNSVTTPPPAIELLQAHAGLELVFSQPHHAWPLIL